MKSYSNKKFGAVGEKLAAEHLKKNGYKILDKNYKNKLGEIDIITQKGDELVFVEVKTRDADPYLSGMYAVNLTKQRHIIRTASLYISENHLNLQPRFDVIEVELDRKTLTLISINHIENAFYQTESYARF